MKSPLAVSAPQGTRRGRVRSDTDHLEVDLSALAAGAIPKIPLVEIGA